MGNLISYNVLLPFGSGFFIALIFTYLVRLLAIKLRWISIPRKGRWHARPVALMGGIAIFLSFSIIFLGLQMTDYVVVWAGGVLMFFVGIYDDRFELKPIIKFLIQFLAVSVLVTTDLTISADWPFWIAIPLTYLWVIGITNAFNLLDNMDGLAAGIAVIVSLFFGALAIKLGVPNIAIIAFALAGASGGFLVFNYNPAKIFMGDCGSLFVGYMMAALPLMLVPELSAINSISILPVLIAVCIIPIFDTTLVTFVRIFKGRSPSQGGSDHASHRLVFSGLSERASVLTLYGISLFFGIVTLLFYPNLIHLFYILFTICLVGLLFFGMYLSRLDVYDDKNLSTIEAMVDRIPAYYKQRMQLVTILVDIVIITVSLALAHFIRFEGWPEMVETAVINILPGIIVLKILVLAAVGMYKSVWRYAGVPDLMRLLIGAFIGTVGAGIYAWIYSNGYISASVFAIDWFLFVFLLASSRFAFKGLQRLFATLQNEGKNVLLYGAGDGGWLALSEIRQNTDLHLNPVGFLDDSSYKKNGRIQGLKVLGGCQELQKVCQDYNIDEVLICIRNLTHDKEEVIMKICMENKIKCSKFIPTFDEIGEKENNSGKKFQKLSYQG